MFLRCLWPIVTPEEWAEKHGLQAQWSKCMECEEPMALDVPFATPEVRGFMGAPCARCGCDKVPFTYVEVLKRRPPGRPERTT